MSAFCFLTGWSAENNGKVAYGSRTGMEVTIRGRSGIDTDHAVVHVEHTVADAREFCEGYEDDFSAACPKRLIREENLRHELTGNCRTGEFTSLYGEHFRFVGENNGITNSAANPPLYRIVNERGHDLDGGVPSRYDEILDEFEALCPARARPGKYERPATCQLSVDGRSYIRGACTFISYGPHDGSFGIQNMPKDKYSAYDTTAAVILKAAGVGEASWNGGPKGIGDQPSLGTVKRNGACWTNDRVQICAK